MAIYRKRTYRKKSFKKKPWYAKKYSPMQAAMKALSGVRYIKGLVNSEMNKVERLGYVSGSANTTGTVALITSIPQGDQDYARTGNSALLKYITSSHRITFNTGVTGRLLKIWIIQDNQGISDTAPAFNDISNGS